MKRYKLNVKGTKLEKRVARICNEHAEDYDNGVKGFYNDLQYAGCQSGMVGELIYYTDTEAFYSRYQSDIDDLLTSTLYDIGSHSPKDLFGDNWDDDDPLARDMHNRNLLAWFGFEEAARRLVEDQYPDLR